MKSEGMNFSVEQGNQQEEGEEALRHHSPC
jgi:hypothetical protein